MAFTEKPPAKPDPTIPRIDPKTGKPTLVWVEYEIKYEQWLARLAAAIP